MCTPLSVSRERLDGLRRKLVCGQGTTSYTISRRMADIFSSARLTIHTHLSTSIPSRSFIAQKVPYWFYMSRSKDKSLDPGLRQFAGQASFCSSFCIWMRSALKRAHLMHFKVYLLIKGLASIYSNSSQNTGKTNIWLRVV